VITEFTLKLSQTTRLEHYFQQENLPILRRVGKVEPKISTNNIPSPRFELRIACDCEFMQKKLTMPGIELKSAASLPRTVRILPWKLFRIEY
jgi:hypothetical protein